MCVCMCVLCACVHVFAYACACVCVGGGELDFVLAGVHVCVCVNAYLLTAHVQVCDDVTCTITQCVKVCARSQMCSPRQQERLTGACE